MDFGLPGESIRLGAIGVVAFGDCGNLPAPPSAVVPVASGILLCPCAQAGIIGLDCVLLAPPHADVPVADGILDATPQAGDELGVPVG